MKINKILAALLALIMLAALAACADGKSADDKNLDDRALTVGAKITADEVDKIWCSMRFFYDKTTEAEALTALVYQKVHVWEADSLGLLPSIEEARQQVRQNYEKMRSGAADEGGEQIQGAEVSWELIQEYLAYTGFSEEEYLEMAAEVWQGAEAMSILRERVYAELPPDADEMERATSAGEYGNALIEKYKDYLVEDDLLPLLDEVLESM